MTRVFAILSVALAFMLSACGSVEPPLETNSPTVTYRYDGSKEGLEKARSSAESYCDDTYDRTPQMLEITHRTYDFKVTYRCIE